jgi:hypothetical protein
MEKLTPALNFRPACLASSRCPELLARQLLRADAPTAIPESAIAQYGIVLSEQERMPGQEQTLRRAGANCLRLMEKQTQR